MTAVDGKFLSPSVAAKTLMKVLHITSAHIARIFIT